MQVKKFIRKNEDIQNFEVKMVIIGCDVEALYPSLEIDECCKVVEEEVMRSTITWGDIDYLEGARFIALHRSTEYCRNHELRKVLPVRRGRKISELMAKLSAKKHQTPQHAKNKTPSGKTRTKQTPTPSSVQKNKLTNYFMNKN